MRLVGRRNQQRKCAWCTAELMGSGIAGTGECLFYCPVCKRKTFVFGKDQYRKMTRDEMIESLAKRRNEGGKGEA